MSNYKIVLQQHTGMYVLKAKKTSWKNIAYFHTLAEAEQRLDQRVQIDDSSDEKEK